MVMPQGIRAGRRRAKQRMKDQCTAERPTGKFTTPDPATRAVERIYEPVTKRYPVQLRSFETVERTDTVGGHRAIVQRTVAKFPVSAQYIPRPGDRITLTATEDRALLGRQFIVAVTPQNTSATAYRVYVDEVTS